MSGYLWVHLVSILIALPFWKRVRHDAKAEDIGPAWSVVWLLVFGIAGLYGFSVHREALVRDMRGARVWGLGGLLVVLFAFALPWLAGSVWMGLVSGLFVWLAFGL
ncbi:MAG TPA: hypothetical protein VFP10_11075, partial [Candidatus Eisenbacteria bacterium]|nr:hypothetical protein [Candidatus Eisenbacteria bacterium]